jgi:hypothetical protein
MKRDRPYLEPLRRLRRAQYRFNRSLQSRWFTRVANRRLASPGPSRLHELPQELIVSLTSYPARFPTLHLTLGCLLDQSVRPDRVILWLAHDDMGLVPPEVRKLEDRGLEIRSCDDLRSFKKLVPALECFPAASIVTADDDLYFRRDWLAFLVTHARAHSDVIGYHRGHRLVRSEGGRLPRYSERQSDVQDQAARRPSPDVLPTTGAGVIFPPRSLAACAVDRELFQRLCAHGDDLWFHWCARMQGTLSAKVGPRMGLHTWQGSQAATLWSENSQGRNDRMIAALRSEFGDLA